VEYRALGPTGLMVSELCLGCMTFGRELDAGESQAMIEEFLGAGGNFIDTANVYAGGESEKITGAALRGRRDDVVLATKVRFSMGGGPNDVGLSRKHIIAACEASLERLGTHYIDLYQVHAWDHLGPIEETLSALTDLVRAGKVRYIGVSNFTGWQLIKAAAVSEARGFEAFISLQPQYSIVERSIEYEVLPACRELRLGLIPWGPLGGGFLSGKYRRGERPPSESRIAHATESMEEAWANRATDRNWEVIDAVGTIAEETGKSYAQVALNWLLCKDIVTAPIIGATKMRQLEDNLGAVGWRLDPSQVQKLDELSAPPALYPYRFIQQMAR
jgi:aryl-alcohol dehydrogenase-like predicted oxidoreductase